MKLRALLVSLALPWAALGETATNSWLLTSPDGRCEISVFIQTDGALSYNVARAGKAVIALSPLGLIRDDESFERGLTLDRGGQTESSREQYELWAGTTPRVDHLVNHRSLTFHNQHGAPLIIDLAAANEGVAFRYQFPKGDDSIHVLKSELTGFAIQSQARGWLQPYHAAGKYTPAYEDFYFHVAPGDRPPVSRGKPEGWAFPALFQIPEAGWVLLTESGTDESFCACHLRPDSSGGLYHLAFPLADEGTRGVTNQFGPEPRSTLPWTMPWRVFVLGQNAGEIALATLVTDLAPPSQIADTSWIRPGRASWAWWSYPEGPATAELFNQFSDFAERMGWEYTMFDAGWWTPGLPTIAAHALAGGVTPLAWNFAGDYYDADKRRRKLDEAKATGVRGVKVDFWCSDRQEAITAMQALFRDAAERKMFVDLHGCTIPRGWQRTWPNYLTAEAVLGDESYFYEPRYTEKAAELNTVLPFTRNAIGPMDLTPVAISPKKYKRLTTAAHELAASIIFTSGIIHYADKPEMFEALPSEVLKIFKDAPARWEETRCLIGEPGRVVVFARRAGKSWFIAGINGTASDLSVDLDLAPFANYQNRLLVSEASDAAMKVAAQRQPASSKFHHRLPPRGGFILRLDE
jgi:hypothetical protein